MSSPHHRLQRCTPSLLLLCLAGGLIGCGTGAVTRSAGGSVAITGQLHGGLQPVSGASVQLFAVGTNGNGSEATSLLSQPVYTDADSNFSIAGDFSCSSPDEQVYAVARGGNPGFAGNVDNPALVLMSALGSCTALLGNPNTAIAVNEVSTVAAAYALAPFTTAFDHVGASATNVTGIGNAFLNAQLLADVSNGQASALPGNLSIEQSKLYALANAIAPCVNSDGGAACAPLFAAATEPGGKAPANVFGALLNIVQHPGNNVAGVFNLISTNPPFPNTMSEAPHDWTMSLTVTGGGLYEPTALAVDHAGNVWVANFGGPGPTGQNPMGVVAYSPQGTPFPGTPFATTQQSEVYGLTLDKNGDVWITSEENISHNGTSGSIAKILGAGSGTPGAFVGQFYDNAMDYPESIAADPAAGTILVGNYASGTASIYDLNGNLLHNYGSGSSVFPDDITSDGSGGLWLANQGDNSVTHIAADGTANRSVCCSAADAVALDPQGNVWVTNFGLSGNAYSISELSSTGSVLIRNQAVPGLSTPGGATVDAGGQFWVLNYHDGSFLGIAGNHTTVPVGTGLSPAALGKDAGLVEPYGIAADPSGNLWISNRAQNSVVMFFGLATPTATPATPRPSAP